MVRKAHLPGGGGGNCSGCGGDGDGSGGVGGLAVGGGGGDGDGDDDGGMFKDGEDGGFVHCTAADGLQMPRSLMTQSLNAPDGSTKYQSSHAPYWATTVGCELSSM